MPICRSIAAALCAFLLPAVAGAATLEALRPQCDNTDGKTPAVERIAACTELATLKQGDARARAMVYVNRAWAYGLEKQWDKAMADYNEAAKIAPDFSVVYNEKGLARLKMGRLDEALVN